MDCIFCKIINGEIPKRTIYEDEICEVIMDAFPTTDGHALILVKEHVTSLDEASDEVVMHVAQIVKRISKQIKETLKPDGVTVFENSGLLQEIPHAHVHVMPTYEKQRGIEFLAQGNSETVEELYRKIIK